jgi:hypothetical protein
MVYLDFVFVIVLLAVWDFSHTFLKMDVQKIVKKTANPETV